MRRNRGGGEDRWGTWSDKRLLDSEDGEEGDMCCANFCAGVVRHISGVQAIYTGIGLVICLQLSTSEKSFNSGIKFDVTMMVLSISILLHIISHSGISITSGRKRGPLIAFAIMMLIGLVIEVCLLVYCGLAMKEMLYANSETIRETLASNSYLRYFLRLLMPMPFLPLQVKSILEGYAGEDSPYDTYTAVCFGFFVFLFVLQLLGIIFALSGACARNRNQESQQTLQRSNSMYYEGRTYPNQDVQYSNVQRN